MNINSFLSAMEKVPTSELMQIASDVTTKVSIAYIDNLQLATSFWYCLSGPSSVES
ncbi:hypothetical protein HAHE_12320 [Haloferula helveola]|uniref:Transposase n=1 Tax=Haloferula helveola TaxID=490095 RepID=A0ABM7RB42_9BACT|nr:hypothetical protein HAHE_12320 [Haloferula helveola]